MSRQQHWSLEVMSDLIWFLEREGKGAVRVQVNLDHVLEAWWRHLNPDL